MYTEALGRLSTSTPKPPSLPPPGPSRLNILYRFLIEMIDMINP